MFAALSAACFAVLGMAPRPAAADVGHVFNVNCPLSHFGSDDPIVSPAQPGNSHRHAFYGNPTTDAFTTTKSLMATTSTCERGFASADHSAYWVPSLYRILPGGNHQEVRLSAEHQHLSAYYRGSRGANGPDVKPFPQGLRMIAGDPYARKPQSTMDVAWRCNGDGRDYQAEIPNCSTGTVLEAIVSFPECWDGVHLDSADHRSHMAVASAEGVCPKSHPVKLPQLTFELRFGLPYVAGATYELSSGGRYSLHGDFFAAWDDRVQSALVNSCLNRGGYCENIERSAVDLTAAGPVMRGREPAPPTPGPSVATTTAGHGSHPSAAAPNVGQTPAAVQATAIPAATTTAPGTWVKGFVGGLGAAVIIGAAIFYSRRRLRRGGHGSNG